jgi:Transposase zinc-binding domain
VRDDLETLYSAIDDGALAVRVPKHARRELEAYLDCGLLCRGFARLGCEETGESRLVAFSCKGRGFCPSCKGRRMSATAANLDHPARPNGAGRRIPPVGGAFGAHLRRGRPQLSLLPGTHEAARGDQGTRQHRQRRRRWHEGPGAQSSARRPEPARGDRARPGATQRPGARSGRGERRARPPAHGRQRVDTRTALVLPTLVVTLPARTSHPDPSASPSIRPILFLGSMAGIRPTGASRLVGTSCPSRELLRAEGMAVRADPGSGLGDELPQEGMTRLLDMILEPSAALLRRPFRGRCNPLSDYPTTTPRTTGAEW